MVPVFTQEQIVESVRAGMKAFNAAGITAIYEGHGIPAEQQRAYLELWSGRELTVRTYFVISYPVPVYCRPEGGRGADPRDVEVRGRGRDSATTC